MGNTPATGGGGSSCSTSTIIAEKSTGSHILRVDGFSGTKGLGVGKSLNSGTFTAGGHSWYIAYFPDGEDEECADWVSVYLHLDRPGPGAKDSAAVKARFEFSLQDRNGCPVSSYRKKSSAVTTFSLADGARCSGHKKFIQRKDFEWL
ncbi:BTB/POZ and MATH domain-containing protein 2-like [Panicum miliaceum]|uniref:BTB/POZ and MATH domain-containing protein 2-like n=1 Tax=Panicum miliaceum TaxID=4540 RepID=A0A3L6PHJ6_PANMI|nr:BTB/POZ and MATH domain-containing protein 2-like [Panicum miliaceum]